MNNIKIKRFTSYLIDLIIITIIVTLLGQIKFLNPYESKYENVAKEYETYYKENFSDTQSISLKDLTNNKYLNFVHDLSLYSIRTISCAMILTRFYFI